MNRTRFAASLTSLLAVLAACATPPTPPPTAPPPPAPPAVAPLLAPGAVDAFYAARAGAPAWRDDAAYDALLAALDGLAGHGLDPERYGRGVLAELRPFPDTRERAATDAWLAAAGDMTTGALDPVTFEPAWNAPRRRVDLAAALTRALASGSVAESLDALAPPHSEYAALRAELARQRALDEPDGVRVPEGPAPETGDSGAAVAALQARLVQLGRLDADAATGVYDSATQTAVTEFQCDAGLDSDGVVGGATRRALNRDRRARIAQLRVNLERWRWLSDDLGERHVRVNVAAYAVSAHGRDGPVRDYDAVVGRPDRATPTFSDVIEFVVINPWWETPVRLAKYDKLPLFQSDPGAAARLGFQVIDGGGETLDLAAIDWAQVTPANFDYRFRQAPGPQNPLGRVKVMFPNPHDVYIHDTPDQALFERSQRAASSGCVRTRDVLDLVAWLLEETPEWDRARIDAAVASGAATEVDLAVPVPVHVLYLTAVPDGAGGVRLLDDFYDRDAAILRALDGDEAAPDS